jgi:putative sterol carrier protein
MGTEVVGIAPPLTIDRECADQIVDILDQAFEAMESDVLAADRSAHATRAARRVESVEALFAAMPGRFDPVKAAGTELRAQFALTGDGGGTWLVVVSDGALDVSKVAEERDDVDCTIRASAADYLQINNGDLSGADAFSTQRLVIDGDLSHAATLGGLGLM